MAEPGLGDGEPEEELGWVGRGGSKGEVEGAVGVVQLLVDELPAHLKFVGQSGDGAAGEGAEGEALAHRWGELTGRGQRSTAFNI